MSAVNTAKLLVSVPVLHFSAQCNQGYHFDELYTRRSNPQPVGPRAEDSICAYKVRQSGIPGYIVLKNVTLARKQVISQCLQHS